MARSFRRGSRFTRRRRSSRGRKAWYTKRYSALQLAAKAWYAAKRLRGLINVEFKKVDLTSTATSSGTVVLLNGVAQGDTDQSRDGNSALMKSLLFRATLIGNAAADQMSVRFILFVDKQQIADTAPSVSDLLDPSGGDNLIAPLNNETVGRFTILVDRRYSLQSVVSGVPPEIPIQFYKQWPQGQHVRFNGSSAGDIQRNGIYFCLIHNSAAQPPTLGYTSRLTFCDN